MFLLASRLAFSWRPVNRWRLLALTSASAVTVVVLLAIAAALRVYDAEAMRNASRLPVPAETEEASLYWAATASSVEGIQYPIIYLEPVAGVPPALPPGLKRLPAPGTAALSPALAARSVADPSVRRWASSGSLITPEGLRDPEELLAYAVPPAGTTVQHSFRALPVKDFGGSRADTNQLEAFFESRLASGPLRLALFGFLIFPVALLLAIASRAAAPRRDRRISLLQALGSPRQATLRLAALEAACLAAVGAVIGALGFTLLRPLVDTVPVVDRKFLPADGAVGLAVTLMCLVAVVLFAAAVAAASLPRQSRDSATSRPRASTALRTRLRLIPLVSGLALCGVAVVFGELQGSPGLLAGTGLALAGLPLAVAPLVKQVGIRLASSASLSTSLAGRRLAFDPAYSARYVTGLVLLVFLSVNVDAWSNRLQSSMERVEAAEATSTVRVSASSPVLSAGRAFAEAQQVVVAPFVTDRVTGSEVLLVDCDTFRRLQVAQTTASCPSVAAESLADVQQAIKRAQGELTDPMGDPMVSATHAVNVAAVPATDLGTLPVDGFYIAANDKLNVSEIREVAFAELALPFVLAPEDLVMKPSPLEKWLAAGLLGAGGLAAVAVAVALVDAVFRRRNEFNAMVALGASRRFLARLVVVEMTTTLAVGVLIALTVGVATSAAMISISKQGYIEVGFLLATLLSAGLLGLIAAAVAALVVLPTLRAGVRND